jgi:hypothetical protein
VIGDHNVPVIDAAGLNFVKLKHLTSIGLIEFGDLAGGYGLKSPRKEIAPQYCGQAHRLKTQDGAERHFNFGRVILTSVGQELLRISNAQGSEDIGKAALEFWAKQGWIEAEEQKTAEPLEGQAGDDYPVG